MEQFVRTACTRQIKCGCKEWISRESTDHQLVEEEFQKHRRTNCALEGTKGRGGK
jgi:hypothetical protein